MARTLLIISMLLAVTAASAADEPLAEYSLGTSLTATVDLDGAIVVHVSDGAFSAPALTCVWPRTVDPRLQADPEIFVTLAREGDVYGRRGFTLDADDDDDGRVNEDRLDGRDNDGDGHIDEDFAAISHAMAAWNWRHGGRSRHLETYHWSYPHLTSLLAAVFTADEGSNPDPLRLSVPDAGWIQADEFCFRAGATGPAFVARIPDPASSGQWLWLGAAVLDTQPRRLATERVHASHDELTIPFLGSTQTIVLAAGPTRLQLAHTLAVAATLRDGVEDPVSGQRIVWLPAAVPTTIPASHLPAADLRAVPAGGFDLALNYTDAPQLFFDPDLFALDGVALAEPVSVAWAAAGERSSISLDWPPDGSLIDACHPYDHLDPAGPGTLILRYSDPAPASGRDLTGVLEDGRRATMPATVEALEVEVTGAAEPALEPGDQRLQLSPVLLSNFPNPFRSSTQVSYQIPATAGEAFLWEGEGDPPFDPRQRLPFASGSASVSVIVYDLEGREIATLQDGILGVGQYQASWNGTDHMGRIMASGAYFCKLQIEKWSVTKRLIFIR